MLGWVAHSALSTGCFLLEHLREGREGGNTDENKDAKQNARTVFIFKAE